MTVSVVFETHATSTDNEAGIATGWRPGELSALGRGQAAELGARRRHDGIAAVLSSDLRRAVQTAELAFTGTDVPILLDWRLRECDYGALNATLAHRIHDTAAQHIVVPYPGGESWAIAVGRVQRVLPDLALRWPGQRVLIVGHIATRWALENALVGTRLDELAATPFEWQPGWEYTIPDDE